MLPKMTTVPLMNQRALVEPNFIPLAEGEALERCNRFREILLAGAYKSLQQEAGKQLNHVDSFEGGENNGRAENDR